MSLLPNPSYTPRVEMYPVQLSSRQSLLLAFIHLLIPKVSQFLVTPLEQKPGDSLSRRLPPRLLGCFLARPKIPFIFPIFVSD